MTKNDGFWHDDEEMLGPDLPDDHCVICEEHADKLYPDESVPPNGHGDCCCARCAKDMIAERIEELQDNEVKRLKEAYFAISGDRYVD